MPLKMYHKKSESSEFWDEHWKKTLEGTSLREYYYKHMHNRTLLPIFEKYLPKEGKIIEGGCGLAPWVYALKEKGYDIEGIDYAEETINFIKSQYPDLPVKFGDVVKLDYPDNSIKGYISLGVVEHYEEGPQKILNEAYRVLDDGGVFICSVPYFNPLRRVKKKLGVINQQGEFSQFAFTRDEICNHIEKIGFDIVDIYYYDAFKGLKDEISFLKPILFRLKKEAKVREIAKMANYESNKSQSNSLRKVLREVLSRLSYSQIICYAVGHMILIVAKAKK
jgi:SAM-dependent methyltransferase